MRGRGSVSDIYEKEDMMKQKKVEKELIREGERTLGCIVGAVLYAVGINFFVVPAGIYTAGIMGICQVIRTLLTDYMHLPFQNFDIAGLIYYVVNIPIFVLAFTRIGRKFFWRTLLTVTAMTVSLALLPIRPIVEDVTAAGAVGGIISGIGAGIFLRMGSSGGGADVIGVLLIKWKQGFSVGKVNLLINLVLYAACLFLFDVETVIYSIIYAAAYSLAIDRVHIQNINVEVHVITKIDTAVMEQEIFTQLGRGITKWRAEGAYTAEPSHVLYIMMSKYEVPHLKAIVHRYDPEAFVVANEGARVEGNFLKKL